MFTQLFPLTCKYAKCIDGSIEKFRISIKAVNLPILVRKTNVK